MSRKQTFHGGSRGRRDAVAALLGASADYEAKNLEGKVPYDVARMQFEAMGDSSSCLSHLANGVEGYVRKDDVDHCKDLLLSLDIDGIDVEE